MNIKMHHIFNTLPYVCAKFSDMTFDFDYTMIPDR